RVCGGGRPADGRGLLLRSRDVDPGRAQGPRRRGRNHPKLSPESMVARLDLGQRTSQALVLLLAVGIGVAAGVDPKVGVAAAIGLAFVVLVVGDLTVGLCLFAVIAFLDVLP